MRKIKVFLVDDHPVVRQGLRTLIGAVDDLEVVGEAGNGREALAALKVCESDVLLLDITMPEMSGLEAIGLIRDQSPSTSIVVFSMHEKDVYIQQVFLAGALGYVLKGASSADIIAAIHAAHRGEHYLSTKIRARVIESFLGGKKEEPESAYDLLSEREQQVFRLMVEGRSTNDIARMLFLSPKTVEKHRSACIKKLGISDLIGMVKYAIRIGVIDPDFWKN